MKPSEEEALKLHRKHGSNERILEHCRTVAKVSKVLASGMRGKGKPVDEESVVAAALLHDIGRNRSHTVSHGVEGALLLKEEGVDEVVVEIVRRHVGAGISASEAKKLGLPDFDYLPKTLEEVIVCFADKMVDGAMVRPFEAEVIRFQAKGHDVERLMNLKRRVHEELGEDPERFIFDKIKASS